MARQLIGVLGYVALFAVFLFVPAGTLHWRAAWILLAVVLFARGLSTARLWMVQRELAIERMKLPIQRGQIAADGLGREHAPVHEVDRLIVRAQA